MNSNAKRQLSPQEGTPGKKARGSYNPRDEAVALKMNPPFKTKTTDPDTDSDDRDKAYFQSEKQREINFEFELALDEDNIKEALAMATTDEQRERARKAAEYIEQVCRQHIYIQAPRLGIQLHWSNKHMHRGRSGLSSWKYQFSYDH